METTVASATSRESRLRELILGSIKRNTKQYTMFIALIAIWVIFALVTDRVFLTPRNLSNLFVQTVTTAILAKFVHNHDELGCDGRSLSLPRNALSIS